MYEIIGLVGIGVLFLWMFGVAFYATYESLRKK